MIDRLVGRSRGELWLGGGFQGDFLAEGFEFADEAAFAGFGVVEAAGEVVRAEVAVGGGLGEHMPNDRDEGVGGGGGGLVAALFAEAAVEATELGADIRCWCVPRPRRTR